MKMTNYLKTLATCLLLTGCGYVQWVTEGDREALDQAKKAGAMVEEKATDPEIKQAGQDTRKNLEVIQRGPVAPPRVDVPYTPENSAEARRRAVKDREAAKSLASQLLSAVGGLTGGAGWITALLSMLGAGGLAMRHKGTVGALIGSVEVLKNRLNPDDVDDAMSAVEARQGKHREKIRKHRRKS